MRLDEARRHRGSAVAPAARRQALSAHAPTLHATRASCRAAAALVSGGAGRVLSVQGGAVQLRLGDRVLSWLADGSPLHPWAFCAPLDRGVPPPGSELRATGGVLAAEGMRVRLDGAERVRLRVVRRLAGPPREAHRRLEPWLPAPASDDPSAAARGALLAGFARGSDAPLGPLLGLGPGLTPSGDDMVLGILAGLDFARDACPGARALRDRLDRELRPRLRSHTTHLSAQLIESALDGCHAEPVLGVLRALAAGAADAAALEPAVVALIATGHRTGAETLRGLTAALERLALD